MSGYAADNPPVAEITQAQWDALVRYAARRSARAHRDAAEDMVQDALVGILSNPGAGFRVSEVYLGIRWAISDAHRKRHGVDKQSRVVGERPREIVPGEAFFAALRDGIDVEGSAIAAAMLDPILALALRDTNTALLVLHEGLGVRQDRLGAIVGCTKHNISKRIKRARLRAREAAGESCRRGPPRRRPPARQK